MMAYFFFFIARSTAIKPAEVSAETHTAQNGRSSSKKTFL
jgi:hypothetical protein